MTTTACPLLDDARSITDKALDTYLPSADTAPVRLHQAMRHAVLAGGKRVRPALVLGACQAVDGDPKACIPAMAAVEFLHTYTLVHDDLPAMDDDDLRRGKPTVHVAFDEATAILTGDALQTLAFTCLSQLPAAAATACVHVLGTASGSIGVVGGQQDDLDSEQARGGACDDPAATLERIHRRKTAALIRAACEMGAICGGAGKAHRSALAEFGEHVGLAFQIIDDLLDVSADASTLGKTPGKDASVGKLTWMSVHGEAAANTAAGEHTAAAYACLERFGEPATPLRSLAAMLLGRES
ncbi:MAG: polyprenyl synthetase family protein [Planctomycetota bacterium]|nr:MAG: polyprenyl synthetase family protein [Planctomycetota bacterium]